MKQVSFCHNKPILHVCGPILHTLLVLQMKKYVTEINSEGIQFHIHRMMTRRDITKLKQKEQRSNASRKKNGRRRHLRMRAKLLKGLDLSMGML